ncbi:YrbL family protein [Saccharospirillum mangrovi]|uniref:YrbL family protein n=1 Tax=Saccharospirillum mangrovi TaxID=2161747 RepID=UPI000D34C051|nr:YrbL family protein [Saccharospirillum mangrovi]
MIFDTLNLSGQSALLSSKTRLLFEHPESEDLLVKVHINRLPHDSLPTWFERRKDHFLYATGILREFKQYVEARYPPRRQDPIIPYIAPIHGVIETDLGLGLLVSAVRSSDGHLAPTVRRLLREGALTESRHEKLQRLLDAIINSEFPLGDLNRENIVLQWAGDESREQFQIIDGLGDRTLIPASQWFSKVAGRRKRRFVERLKRTIAEAGYA